MTDLTVIDRVRALPSEKIAQLDKTSILLLLILERDGLLPSEPLEDEAK